MVSMLLLSSEEKRPVMPRVLGCRACEQITSGDCGMHGPVIIPLSPPGWLGRAIEDAKPCECLALRAEVAAERKRHEDTQRQMEHWRDEWDEAVNEQDILREERDDLKAEVARLKTERDDLKAEVARLKTDFQFAVEEFRRERETTAALGARLAALTDPATVERAARAIRDAFCRGIPDHGRTPCVVEVGDREAARAALAALGDVKPPATRNLP